MATLAYELNYAGIPLLLDWGRVVRINMDANEQEDATQLPPRKHQPLTDLIDEVDRILPFFYLQDICGAPAYPGRNVGALARQWNPTGRPSPFVRINDWWYPFGAQRWSIFRGLATSTMVKEIIKKVQPTTGGGTSPKTFTMKCVPISPANKADSEYKLESSMYMLPPRPLAEHGDKFDGLYLITLVDERYYWQYTPVSFAVTATSTWADLISSLATALGVTISYSAIPRVYSSPETDSQLWCNQENAALLLDAVAYSIGRTVVRNLDGTYNLYTPIQSQALVNTNRGIATKVVRTAGGDIFNSGVQRLKVGELGPARDFIVPTAINVAFPRYVQGNDPVPHYLNARYRNPRPTAWFEQSYGSVLSISTPITSGSMQASGGLVVPDDATQPKVAALSGLVGISTHSIHTTAKALYSGEIAANPVNQSGLTSLAMQLAGDFYNYQVAAALDEVYPGSFKWTPEGLHEIVWTWSARTKQGTCRVFRGEWNQIIDEMQHAAHSGSIAAVPAGVGGLSVPQTWRGSPSSGLSGSLTAISTTLNAAMLSGDYAATLAGIDNFPTQNRWRGVIRSGQSDEEIALFEGTSGGASVGVVWRGIDGTIQQPHSAGDSVIMQDPQRAYGANLVTHEKMQFIYPGAWTSGGISEAVVVPQIQTVQVLAATPRLTNTINFWSGRVESYDPTRQSGLQFMPQELCWVAERNTKELTSGTRYDGQLVGYSVSGSVIGGAVAPIYLVDEGRDETEVIATSCCDSWKTSVRLATTGNLAATRSGNTLTLTAAGAQTIDGVALAGGDRLLVKDQTTGADNGIYEALDPGAGGIQCVLRRANDFDESTEIAPPVIIRVSEGNLNADSEWMLTTNGVTINSTSLTFSRVGLNPATSFINFAEYFVSNSVISDSTSEKALLTITPGELYFAATGDVMLFEAAGVVTTGSYPPSMTLRVRLESVIVASVTFTPPANLGSITSTSSEHQRQWFMKFATVVQNFATGAAQSMGYFILGDTAAGQEVAVEINASPTLVLGSNTLELTLQYSEAVGELDSGGFRRNRFSRFLTNVRQMAV